MKLFIVLSLIACGYAAKLDRTYLPPSSAATAGGSPGSLNAPVGPSGSAGFGQPAANSGFGQPAAFGPSNGPSFDKSATGAYGSQPSGFAPSAQYSQTGSPSEPLDPGFSQVAQNFGSSQGYQRSQSQRAQAAADQNAEILRLDNQNDGESFSYSFETSNGIAAEESGVATNGVQAQGAFSYSDDDGQNFRVTYTADENGYQPQGDHLPTPHPVPEEILKSIEKNAQAAAAGIQEGAYNPDEDNSASAPQSYTYNAPTSYNQGPSGSSSISQQGSGPSSVYGAANAGGSRPQSGAQGFQPQGPSQQYGAPNAGGSGSPSIGFGSSQQGPSQAYSSPSSGPSGANGALQAKPNSFSQNKFQSQGPSQQYDSPSRLGTPGSSNGFGPSANGFSPSGPASQPRPSQYQVPQSGFPSAGRPQGSAQVGQQQDASGYQYDRPQGSFGTSNSRLSNQGSAGNQGPAGQYRPQNGGSQPSGPQGFPKPNSGSAGYQSGPAQGSFGPSTGPSAQGSFGSALGSNAGAFGPSSGPKGPSSFGPNAGSTGQDSFGAASGPGPSSFGPSGSNGQSSFGPSSGPNGFGRPQGSFAGAEGAMTDSGYTYNSPSSQAGVGSQPQGGSNVPGSSFGGPRQQLQGGSSAPGSSFGGPRQPPSFSEEEGYKY